MFSCLFLQVRHSKVIPPNEEILKYSRYFEDELTLDDLNTLQLQGLCKLLGIGITGNIPSRTMLRWQIGLKLRELQVDDKVLWILFMTSESEIRGHLVFDLFVCGKP